MIEQVCQIPASSVLLIARQNEDELLAMLFGEGDEFVGGGEGAGQVDQPGGKPHRPRLHGRPHLLLHAGQFRGGREKSRYA